GCSNITIDGITGVMYDDLLDVAAFRASTGANTGYIHPYTASLTDAQRNCSDITIRNVSIFGQIMVRCLNGDGSTITRVTAENITNRKVTGEIPAFMMGPALSYTTDPPAVGSISNVTIRGYRGPASRLVSLDSHVDGLSISDCQITNWRHLVGNQLRNAAFFPVLTRICVRDIQITGDWTDQGAALDGGGGFLCKFDGGVNVDDLEIGNVTA